MKNKRKLPLGVDENDEFKTKKRLKIKRKIDFTDSDDTEDEIKSRNTPPVSLPEFKEYLKSVQRKPQSLKHPRLEPVRRVTRSNAVKGVTGSGKLF